MRHYPDKQRLTLRSRLVASLPHFQLSDTKHEDIHTAQGNVVETVTLSGSFEN